MKTTKILIYLISFVFVLGITPGGANADLVAYWPMDDGEGITVSDLVGPWDGTITGNVTWVDGKVGKALEFPGGSNFVNCGNVDIGESLTLSYWCFNPDKTFERPIGQHSGNYTTDPGWCVYSRNETEGGVWFRVHGADNAWNGGDIIIADILPKTEWFHLTFTFDGPTRELKGYLNGEPKVSKICEEGRCIYPNTNDLRLGNVGTGAAFTGMLDEVAVWDTALTADEVLDVFNLGVNRPRNPSPADGAKVPVGDVDLSWTNMDPNNPGGPVYVDVWFGTEPNKLHPGYDMTKVVAANPADPDRTTWTVSAPTEGTYYWQINSYIYGVAHINEPNAIEGPLWSFYAVEDAPPSSVDAGVPMITWSGQPVPLDATVVDDGKSALTYLWTADAPVGVTVAFDPGAAVEDPTVTITNVPYSNAPIVNAGFEDQVLADGEWGSAPGWSNIGDNAGGGSWNPGFDTGAIGYGGEAPEGSNIAYVGFQANSTGGGIAQVLTETLASDTTYELTVEVGDSPLYDWPGYKVQLLAGGNLLAEDDNSLTVPDNDFVTSTVTYTSGDATDPNIGLPLEIRLLVVNSSATGWLEMNFDDVQLTANPPFPAPTGLSIVDLTLAVNDEGNPTPVTDSITIDVYDDACQAARLGVGLSELADFDLDCNIDLDELEHTALQWLVDTSPTEAFVDPVQPDDNPVPNGEFNIYKPGTNYTVAGTFDPDAGSTYAPFNPGPDNVSMASGKCVFEDGSEGTTFDMPGWTRVFDPTPEYPNATRPVNVHILNGNTYIRAFGEWSGGETSRIKSSEPFGVIKGGKNYTLSAKVSAGGDTRVLRLIVDGEEVPPTSSVDPADSDLGDWQVISRTYYSEPNLISLVGRPMTIELGTDNPLAQPFAAFDDVRIDFENANPNDPNVDAGADMATWSGQAVQLAPTVANNDPAQPTLSYLWTADPADGVVFSATDIEAPTVTITKATANPSTVTLTLAVTRPGSVAITDTMTIDVYDTACIAAISTGTLEVNATDFDENCITDLKDYAVLAATWLVDYELTAPVAKP